MKIIYIKSQQIKTKAKVNDDEICLAIGNFDGIHIAHQELLKNTMNIVKNNKQDSKQGNKLKSGVLIFSPHPLLYFHNAKNKKNTENIQNTEIKFIQTLEEKISKISEFKIDYLFVLEFDGIFANMSADDFFINILIKYINAKHIITGYNFYYGANRMGDTRSLALLSSKYDIKYKCINEIKYKNNLVSSSKIRKYLNDGDIELVNKLLNKIYILSGVVIKGDSFAKQYFGINTANIELNNINKQYPSNGVYVVNIVDIGFGIANMGVRPTIHRDGNLILEVHIFDIDINLYDEYITVEFLHFLRKECKFDNVEDLKQQILDDIQNAKQYIKLKYIDNASDNTAFKTSLYDFVLPKYLIAKYPLKNRDQSKMLYVNSNINNVNNGDKNADNIIKDLYFYDVISLLNPGDILIFNDAKVIPSYFKCKVGNGFVSINLTKQLDDSIWQILAKPAKKLDVGSRLTFVWDEDFGEKHQKSYRENDYHENDDFEMIVLQKNKNDMFINVKFNKGGHELLKAFYKYGKIPLPPYIKREVEESDKETYQTVYAKNLGAVASPTAGLHFTQDLLKKIKEKGIVIKYITLHVSGGTFLPIKSDNINDHVMHSEKFSICQNTILAIKKAMANGNKIVCVGTTSLRVIESMADIICKEIMEVAMEGSMEESSVITNEDGYIIINGEINSETNIFIKPGYKFKVANALITNFHLPKSTLFVLISAIVGRDMALSIYEYAVAHEYRFFSYGDSCFFEIHKPAKLKI